MANQHGIFSYSGCYLSRTRRSYKLYQKEITYYFYIKIMKNTTQAYE